MGSLKCHFWVQHPLVVPATQQFSSSWQKWPHQVYIKSAIMPQPMSIFYMHFFVAFSYFLLFHHCNSTHLHSLLHQHPPAKWPHLSHSFKFQAKKEPGFLTDLEFEKNFKLFLKFLVWKPVDIFHSLWRTDSFTQFNYILYFKKLTWFRMSELSSL